MIEFLGDWARARDALDQRVVVVCVYARTRAHECVCVVVRAHASERVCLRLRLRARVHARLRG